MFVVGEVIMILLVEMSDLSVYFDFSVGECVKKWNKIDLKLKFS